MKKIILTLSFCLLFLITHGQELTVDLSKSVNQTYSQTIDPQIIKQIKIINRSVANHYSVDIKKEHILIPPIDVSEFSGGPAGVCAPLETAKDNLANEVIESKIPAEIVILKNEINNAQKVGSCADDISDANGIIAATTEYYNLQTQMEIRTGDKVTLTISKDANTKWTFIFSTETVNHGKVFYGFTYLFSDALTHFPTYFAEASDDGKSYTITKSNSTTKNVFKNLTPTFLYTYAFFKNPDQVAKFGLTGGFMVDLSNPSVLVSPSLIIGDSFSINLGCAFTQKDQLLGQYHAGQVIKDNLTFDQLHGKVWTYDMFISVAFHFSSNPFKKSNSSSAATPTPAD